MKLNLDLYGHKVMKRKHLVAESAIVVSHKKVGKHIVLFCIICSSRDKPVEKKF